MTTPQQIWDAYRKDPNHDMYEFSPFLRTNARGSILEIGVRGGVSTAAFLLGLEKNCGRLISVDRNLKCGLLFSHPQWMFIGADSQDPFTKEQITIALRAIAITSYFDIVFLDGAHYREGIRSDLRNYADMLKLGGLLLVHDIYGLKNPTPEQIAEDWPTEAVGEEFYAFTREMQWPTFELPGQFGMGVAVRV